MINQIRKVFYCFTAVFVFLYNVTFAQILVPAAVQDKLYPALSVQMNGFIGTKLDASYQNRILAQDIWGRKYCMLGLLAYYDLTRDVKSLDAAGKLADHLIKELAEKKALIGEKANFRGMAASSILEPITQLYVRTNDKKYLVFAEEIVHQWELPVHIVLSNQM